VKEDPKMYEKVLSIIESLSRNPEYATLKKIGLTPPPTSTPLSEETKEEPRNLNKPTT